MKRELLSHTIDTASSGGAPTGILSPRTFLHLSDPFWRKVEIRGEDECWPYLGHIDRDGYGKYRHHGAHREAFRLANGRSAGLHVLHSCDNPPCCNPAHLCEGTHADNMADCASKNRHHFGSMTHCKRGHEFTASNTYMRSGRRICRACHRASESLRRQRAAVAS